MVKTLGVKTPANVPNLPVVCEEALDESADGCIVLEYGILSVKSSQQKTRPLRVNPNLSTNNLFDDESNNWLKADTNRTNKEMNCFNMTLLGSEDHP